jgi:phage-related minor tail protein
MSVDLDTIPRTVVRLGVTAARIPLSAAEAMLGHRDDDQWPPTVAFDRIDSTVKSVLANVLHDDVLAAEANLLAGKMARRQDADRLASAAEAERQTADNELKIRRDAAEARRETAVEEAAERSAKVKRDEVAAKHKVQTRAAGERAAADERAAAEMAVAKRNDRRKRSATLAAEEQALASEQAAAAKVAEAEALDAQIASHKRRRTT